MPTTVKTFSERFRGLEDAVDRAFRSVYNTDASNALLSRPTSQLLSKSPSPPSPIQASSDTV
jgi:hypothetical protein